MYRLNEKIRDLTPYQPIKGNYPVRLDANESFLSPPLHVMAKIMEAAATVPYNRYPDSRAAEPCAAFALLHNISAESVTAGNGSDELISVICGAFLMKGDTVMTASPDFAMYRFYSSIDEAKCIEYQKKPDLLINVNAMISAAKEYDVKLILFSNPCNPTSLGLTKAEVRKLLTSVNALVVVDEAYMDFWSESLLQETENYDNLIVLRTCSKAIGMAGIRLGFAVANSTLTNALRAVKSPYNVNALTQKIGSILLSEKEWIRSSAKKIVRSREELYAGLKRAEKNHGGKLEVFPSVTNFVLVRLSGAEQTHRKLLEEGIAVRLLGESYLRITAGNARENAAFLRTFEAALK